MFSKHPWIALAVALATVLAPSAGVAAPSAGTGAILSSGGIRVLPQTVNGEDVNTLIGLYLGIAECTSNVPVVFRLDGVNAELPSIDVYLGESCNSADRRDTTANRCRFITTMSKGSRVEDIDITVMAGDLFEACDNNRSGEPTLWFLAVRSPEGTEVVDQANYGALRINLDTERPLAPTGVEGGSGESVIQVEWSTDDVDLEGFTVYIDRSPVMGSGGDGDGDGGVPASSGACTSSVLRPGEPAMDVPGSVATKTINEQTATRIELSPGDIGSGNMAAVAVASVDMAGNASPLSNIGCVQVVPTEGFWDRYQANGGEATGGCPCRASGSAELKAAWPIALALLLLQRRRARRIA